MKPMHRWDGTLFGFMFESRDERVEYRPMHGLFFKQEFEDWLSQHLLVFPRLDRNNSYILLIPRDERDLFFLKMKWC